MKAFLVFSLALFALLAAAQVSASDDTVSEVVGSSTTNDPNCEDVANEKFVTGNLVYSIKLLIDQSRRNPGNNVVVGGASILYLIGQLGVASTSPSGLTTEVLNVLNLENTEQILCYLPNVSANLTATYQDIEFKLYCNIYADQNYALTPDFIQTTGSLFGIPPVNLNFTSPSAAETITADVKNITNIQNFVKASTMESLDGLVMVDAEEFQGKWDKQFNPADTTMKKYYYQGRIYKIPTMYQRGTFLTANSVRLNAKLLKLKYRGERFSVVIFLPNFINGMSEMLRKMENPRNILGALDSLKYQNIEVFLPKFNISVANRLKVSSEMAGLKEIFNNETTALKGISSASPPFVSEILQRINFDLDEYGMGNQLDIQFPVEKLPRPPKFALTRIFKADHPFAWALYFDDIMVQAGIFNH